MNKGDAGAGAIKAPTVEELERHGLKAIVIIVNRADGDRTVRYLRERRFHMHFTCMAQGTQGSSIMELLGLGTVDKTLVLCIALGDRIDALLGDVERDLNLKKAGKGIAFTIYLSGLRASDLITYGIPHYMCGSAPLNRIGKPAGHRFDESADAAGNMRGADEKLSNEVSDMNDGTGYSIILAIVDKGNSEELVKTAKGAGARGGTVIDARSTGAEETVKFFGLTVQSEKEIVAILTSESHKKAIMDSVAESFGLNSPAHGIVLCAPVDGVAGVSG